ncbi:MAG: SDR family oxidoreductase, partial [Rubrivivax sp.]
MAAWDRLIAINLTGSYRLHPGGGAPHGDAQERPHHHAGVAIGLAGVVGARGLRVVEARCAGADQVLRPCAIDLALYGIGVNSVSPWPIETPQTAVLHNQVVRDAIVRETPMARYGQPDEVADVIDFLASDEALRHRPRPGGRRRADQRRDPVRPG